MKSERAVALLVMLAAATLTTSWPRPALARPAAAGCWRQVAANWCWLRARVAWERRDETAVRRWLQASLSAQPASRFFRVNAARVIAYDLPVWRNEANSAVPHAIQRAWRRTAANEAIALLLADERAVDADVLCEAATLALYAKDDPALATRLFRAAAEISPPAAHAARIHARLLATAGRGTDAIGWMDNWLKTSSPDLSAAERQRCELLLADLRLQAGKPTGGSAP